MRPFIPLLCGLLLASFGVAMAATRLTVVAKAPPKASPKGPPVLLPGPVQTAETSAVIAHAKSGSGRYLKVGPWWGQFEVTTTYSAPFLAQHPMRPQPPVEMQPGKPRIERYRLEVATGAPTFYRVKASYLNPQGAVTQEQRVMVKDGRIYSYYRKGDQQTGSYGPGSGQAVSDFLGGPLGAALQLADNLVRQHNILNGFQFQNFCGQSGLGQCFSWVDDEGGWTAIWLDPERGYMPTQIWRGNDAIPGASKDVLADFAADELGRWMPRRMVIRTRLDDKDIPAVDREIKCLEFQRTIPAEARSWSFPRGTHVSDVIASRDYVQK